mmetsp:Transcript_73645/g.158003  ORF Transcript_73645/g.158003 Transcript_73645/m.158003 type:complete len:246 (+) Transcript_73645:1466-2203(+)
MTGLAAVGLSSSRRKLGSGEGNCAERLSPSLLRVVRFAKPWPWSGMTPPGCDVTSSCAGRRVGKGAPATPCRGALLGRWYTGECSDGGDKGDIIVGNGPMGGADVDAAGDSPACDAASNAAGNATPPSFGWLPAHSQVHGQDGVGSESFETLRVLWWGVLSGARCGIRDSRQRPTSAKPATHRLQPAAIAKQARMDCQHRPDRTTPVGRPYTSSPASASSSSPVPIAPPTRGSGYGPGGASLVKP